MEWRGEGIVLGVRRHGETSVVVELLTPERGRHLGLVRGGRSRRLQPVLQPGNQVEVTWRARLDEHLGFMTVEPVTLRAARLMEGGAALHGIQLLGEHVRLLPERDPQPRLYEMVQEIVDRLGDPVESGLLLLRFEVALLEDLGFGLDLDRCAATGSREDLAYVSPRTGRSVGREAGEPWRDRLLPLPACLCGSQVVPDAASLLDGFRMTGYFLARHVWEPRAMPEPASRAALVAAIGRAGAGQPAISVA